MKKVILFIAFILTCNAIMGQNDTTIVKKDVRFEKEVYTAKNGDNKEYYYAYIDDVCYSSNKTSYERYKAYKRFGIKPTYALITNKKGKRIIIL